jgi:hypothetical protein
MNDILVRGEIVVFAMFRFGAQSRLVWRCVAHVRMVSRTAVVLGGKESVKVGSGAPKAAQIAAKLTLARNSYYNGIVRRYPPTHTCAWMYVE